MMTLLWTGLLLQGTRTLYICVRCVVHATTTMPKGVLPIMSMRASLLRHVSDYVVAKAWIEIGC